MKGFRAFLPALGMCLVCVLGTVQADYSAWSQSQTFYLNTTASGVPITTDVHAIPLLIRLTASNFDFSQEAAGGADIRFSGTSGTALPYEIETWDATAQQAAIWVLADTVSAGTGDRFIRMHWGNSSAASESDCSAVFSASAGYLGVFHLHDAETAFNATGNTAFEGIVGDTLVLGEGNCGTALEFPLTNTISYVRFHNHALTSPSDQWYWSIWFKPYETARQAPIVANFAPSGNRSGPKLIWGASPSQTQC